MTSSKISRRATAFKWRGGGGILQISHIIWTWPRESFPPQEQANMMSALCLWSPQNCPQINGIAFQLASSPPSKHCRRCISLPPSKKWPADWQRRPYRKRCCKKSRLSLSPFICYWQPTDDQRATALSALSHSQIWGRRRDILPLSANLINFMSAFCSRSSSRWGTHLKEL